MVEAFTKPTSQREMLSSEAAFLCGLECKLTQLLSDVAHIDANAVLLRDHLRAAGAGEVPAWDDEHVRNMADFVCVEAAKLKKELETLQRLTSQREGAMPTRRLGESPLSERLVAEQHTAIRIGGTDVPFVSYDAEPWLDLKDICEALDGQYADYLVHTIRQDPPCNHCVLPSGRVLLGRETVTPWLVLLPRVLVGDLWREWHDDFVGTVLRSDAVNRIGEGMLTPLGLELPVQ